MVKIQTDKVNKKLTTFTTRKNVSFPTLPNVHLTQCDMPAISVKSLLLFVYVLCSWQQKRQMFRLGLCAHPAHLTTAFQVAVNQVKVGQDSNITQLQV